MINNQLGAYTLPGRSIHPLLAIEQAKVAEEIGLGTIWLSERFGTKDAATVLGAMAQATTTINLGVGITHFQTRHPLALASMALTLQALSEGRFILGMGRSVPLLMKAWGLPPSTNELLIDGVRVLKQLMNGERVKYEGPLGTFPVLQINDLPEVTPPPVMLAAIGPISLDLAGANYDGVILHPFLSLDAQRNAVDIARAGAEKAGRDPNALRVVATVVAAADMSQEETDMRVRARLITYLNAPGLGLGLVKANDWDPGVIDAVNAHPLIAALGRRSANGALNHEQLVEVSQVVPEYWFTDAAAVGTTQQVATRLKEYLDAGADEILIHGSTPEFLAPTVKAVDELSRN